MKLVNGFWCDENGNRWHAIILQEHHALERSQGLINCYNCTNCRDCVDCNNCRNCKNCRNCVGCGNCINCNNCQDIIWKEKASHSRGSHKKNYK